MSRTLATLCLSLIALTAVQAQGNNAFEQYKRQKMAQFEGYKQRKQAEFDAYRRQRNETFARFMERKWELVRGGTPVTLPEQKEVKPPIYDQRDDQRDDRQMSVTVVPIEQRKPQPKPVEPIEQNRQTTQQGRFAFYGTPMTVRWGNLTTFKLKSTNEKDVAKAFLTLTDKDYTDLTVDCLTLRRKHQLCDWAYYKMLESMAQTACGKSTNEAVLVQGVLLNQSGYKLRFAREPQTGRLHLLMHLASSPLDCQPYTVNRETFYLMDGSKPKSLNVLDAAYKGEQTMSLNIDQLPLLQQKLSVAKNLQSADCALSATSVVNENLIAFMNDYPRSYCNNNFMTRWAYYANTPISSEVKQKVYPVLRQKLQGMTQRMAVNQLLAWVQFCFPYEFDINVWQVEDRAFFADETLFYPLSDCEDHAILFSKLVRDLVGLDAALVYYPGHLMAAVCFTDEVKGDAINVGGRRFVLCEATGEGYPAGRISADYKNVKGEAILLRR